jgi:hypothetical protein
MLRHLQTDPSIVQAIEGSVILQSLLVDKGSGVDSLLFPGCQHSFDS